MNVLSNCWTVQLTPKPDLPVDSKEQLTHQAGNPVDRTSQLTRDCTACAYTVNDCMVSAVNRS